MIESEQNPEVHSARQSSGLMAKIPLLRLEKIVDSFVEDNDVIEQTPQQKLEMREKYLRTEQ